MTTSVLDRVDLDRIEQRARQARPGRALLTLIASLLFLAGFGFAKTMAVVWLSAAWSVAAFREGMTAARGPSRGQQLASLAAENKRLRAENDRLS